MLPSNLHGDLVLLICSGISDNVGTLAEHCAIFKCLTGDSAPLYRKIQSLPPANIYLSVQPEKTMKQQRFFSQH